MNKPVIVAICGKSAAGKDTLAKRLYFTLKDNGIPSKILVSDTTRFPRTNEQIDEDYYFITQREFENKIANKLYLEYTKFRGWYYGLDKRNISQNVINIAVFDAQGIYNLSKLKNEYTIFPVYIAAPFFERIRRSINREGKFKIEYIRRAICDWKDFKYLPDFIHNHFTYHMVFHYRQNLSDISFYIYQKIRQCGLYLGLGKKL